MSENDLKAVLAKYQQKAFELFNQNIVLETQVEQLNVQVTSLTNELQKLSQKAKRTQKSEDFT
jgi:predicted  nucleic acid-binding Zn-ribbon protein